MSAFAKSDLAASIALGALLTVLALISTGTGIDQSITVSSADTWIEIGLTLVGGGACATALVLAPGARWWGAPALGLFAALTAYTALSIVWSVQPDDSWQATNLTVAYLGTFAAAWALARVAPGRWVLLVQSLTIATVALTAAALLTKVFPASLAAGENTGRLQGPLGYWNATGALAVFGLPLCLWAWTRRDSPALGRALAIPGAGILLSVLILSYSRSALLVAVIAVALWLWLVPRRLLSAAALALSAGGAAVISGWGLSKTALSTDNVALAARDSAGHTFGAIVLVVLMALGVAGYVAARAADRSSLTAQTRRRVGTVLLGGVACLPVLAIIALAASSRGLTGEISHAWSSLTSVNSTTGNSASRIVALGNSRPLYWSEGITVGDHSPLHGVGALGFGTARTRYTTNPDVVLHAHSYLIQTYADLGLIGLALSLALLVAWGAATARALGGRAKWRSLPEGLRVRREAMAAIAIAVVAFGLQSAIDWTWYFPGVAVPALLAAGWLAGALPLGKKLEDGVGEPVGTRAQRRSILDRPATGIGVVAIAAVALLISWLIWQPLRSSNAVTASENAAASGNTTAAFNDARDAVSSDPLALQPLLVLSALYEGAGRDGEARSKLVEAVGLQPHNYAAWLSLGSFDLRHHQPALAIASLQRAYTLDPEFVPTSDELALARSMLGHS